MKSASPEFVSQAQQLTREEREHVLSRMKRKLTKKWLNEKVITEEAIALQLELEDEWFKEFIEQVRALRKADKTALDI
jgi:hypothetical protein